MKTSEFLELLENNKDKEVRFEYLPGKLVGANYHITEIKNVSIDSVDCGARTDSWKETIVQLWESPDEKGKKNFMSAFKALGILKKVHRIKPMQLDTTLKFEYGNAQFHAAQLFVDGFAMEENALTIRLSPTKTDCKAKDACGVEPVKEVVQEACCSPGSGCC
ncbi:MAG: hypothetical protein CMH48_01955 [Muricauda sp.]|nr:DUF6428 family protein [Allomuricauda sp.]MBC29584.1 hypothetical protein [Allomuricauda sp.]|tara:strand:+ start:4233 stop:4721 length:489 start_codon:yes stop_codon:yes gene_type:complete